MTLLPKILAEAAGTFTMIFIGGGSILLVSRGVIPAFVIPLAWGGVIALMIAAMGVFSEAHFNPAVTLAFAAAERWPVSQVAVYWASQFCGGLAAIGLLEIIKKN